MTEHTHVLRVRDGRDWDEGLLQFPIPHPLQTWAWGDLKAQTGWQATPLRVLQSNRPIGQALLLRRAVGPLAIGYVPKGPILDWSDPQHARGVLAALAEEARQQRMIFVKIDPDVPADTEMGRSVRQVLEDLGWRPSPQAVQFRNTVLLDLRGSEEDLLARMKSKWRYNIRLARRRGVQVRKGGQEELPTFYRLYAETARRDQFLIRPYTYYAPIWQRFLQEDRAIFLLAEWEGQPVAGLILFLLGKRAWYMYGASAGGAARRHMPNHLLQWEAMRAARARGCTVYDMWGAPDVLDERDPMWGVYRFKTGFGGVFQPWIGPWDMPLMPVLYRLYVHTLPQFMHRASRALTLLRSRMPGR